MKKILLCMGLSALFAGCGGREKPLAEVVDEALARVVVDLSGRPHLSWRCPFPEATAGGVSCMLYHKFFQSLANAAAITLHVDLLAGEEIHHCLEAIFKAFGRALRQAVARDPEMAPEETPSTKGVLE